MYLVSEREHAVDFAAPDVDLHHGVVFLRGEHERAGGSCLEEF